MTEDDAVRVLVNDEPHAFVRPLPLRDALERLGLAVDGVAVAVEGEVVPRSAWDGVTLRGGERLLVLKATQGG